MFSSFSKTKLCFTAFALGFLTNAYGQSLEAQLVLSDSSSDQAIEVDVVFDPNGTGAQTNFYQLAIHFDSSQVNLTDVKNLYSESLIIVPSPQLVAMDGLAIGDIDDGDALTDRNISFSYNSASSLWPSQMSRPIVLGTLVFDPIYNSAGVLNTTIRSSVKAAGDVSSDASRPTLLIEARENGNGSSPDRAVDLKLENVTPANDTSGVYQLQLNYDSRGLGTKLGILGYSLHFDSSVFSFESVEVLVGESLLSDPNDEGDVEDSSSGVAARDDGSTETDRHVLLSYLQNDGQWPTASESGPIPLAIFKFSIVSADAGPLESKFRSFVNSDGAVTEDLSLPMIALMVPGPSPPVNQPPVAQLVEQSVREDEEITFALSASDPEGATLQYRVVTNPIHGAFQLNGSQLTYSPPENFNGSDQLEYVVNDGTLDSAIAQVKITVQAVNDQPVVEPLALTVLEDTSKAINVAVSDVDGDSLSFVVSVGPANGALEGQLPNLLYTPSNNFAGTDVIEFTVTDNIGDPVAGVVNLTVTGENDAPTAAALQLNTQEDTEATITLQGSDPEGVSLQYRVVTQPANGTLVLNADQLTYRPNANFNGMDQIAYVANDGDLDSATALIQVQVTSVNDLPVVQPLAVTVLEDQPKNLSIDVTDIDGDTLTFAITTPPSNGALAGELPSLVYTPASNFVGEDSIQFTVSDGNGEPVTGSVQLTVTDENDAPTVQTVEQSLQEDGEITLQLVGADPEGVSLQFRVVTEPTNGEVELVGSELTYRPNANFNGIDSLQYVANDGELDSAPANVNFQVAAVNDLPSVQPLTATLSEDMPQSLAVQASDADGDSLVFQIKNAPMHGAITGDLPNIVYTPTQDYAGMDVIEFTVSDGIGSLVDGLITLTITAQNDAPTAGDITVNGTEDTDLPITLSGSDVETPNTVTYEVVRAPQSGALEGTGASIIYKPNPNFFGTDSFSYRVGDGEAFSNAAEVTITVAAVNDNPVANDGTFVATGGLPVTVDLSAIASDLETANLTYAVGQPSAGASASLEASTLTYTAQRDFSGDEQLTFTATDEGGLSATGTLSFAVSAAAIEVSVQAPSDIQQEASATLTPVDLGTATLTGADAGSFHAVPDNQGPFPVGVTEVLWQVFSGDSLLASDMQQVTIVDTTAPVVTAPNAVTLVADGRRVALTEELLGGVATGADVVDNCEFGVDFQPKDPVDSGLQVVTWSVTDCHGNTGAAEQLVTLLPTASLMGGAAIERGSSGIIEVQLSGPAPEYPVNVPLVFTGDAVLGSDFSLGAQSIVIESGLTGSIPVQFIEGGDLGFVAQTLDVSINAETLQNAAASESGSSTQFTIAATNRPPQVVADINVGEEPVAVVIGDDNQATITVTISDPNSADSHQILWEPLDSQVMLLSPANESELIVDVSGLAPGIYPIRLTVTEDGATPLAIETIINLVVDEQREALSAETDSNGNGSSDTDDGAGDPDGNGVPAYLERAEVANELPQVNDDNFFLRSDPGTQLRLGAIAALNGRANGYIASLTLEQLRNYANANNISFASNFDLNRLISLVDFEVHGVARGESVSIVIPQTAAIPQNAIYAKFNSQGWARFEENASNSVASARGALGACPDPGSSEYRRGLRAGDFCVHLTIQDGGANDTDGLDDGVVRDPGGVVSTGPQTTQVSLNDSYRSGGGGSAGWLVLLMSIVLIGRILTARSA